jgi:hypothetical protein
VANRTESASWGQIPAICFLPSFIVICSILAAVFCNLHYIFVTASRSSRTHQGAHPVERAYSHIVLNDRDHVAEKLQCQLPKFNQLGENGVSGRGRRIEEW